jgi:hypothetical protein
MNIYFLIYFSFSFSDTWRGDWTFQASLPKICVGGCLKFAQNFGISEPSGKLQVPPRRVELKTLMGNCARLESSIDAIRELQIPIAARLQYLKS